jgi:hypothetical protein
MSEKSFQSIEEFDNAEGIPGGSPARIPGGNPDLTAENQVRGNVITVGKSRFKVKLPGTKSSKREMEKELRKIDLPTACEIMVIDENGRLYANSRVVQTGAEDFHIQEMAPLPGAGNYATNLENFQINLPVDLDAARMGQRRGKGPPKGKGKCGKKGKFPGYGKPGKGQGY